MAQVWWKKFCEEMLECGARGEEPAYIWCQFNVEGLRHLDPHPFLLPGWMVLPRRRVPFIRAETGELGKSPGNMAAWWSTVEPAEPPEESLIVETGHHNNMIKGLL